MFYSGDVVKVFKTIYGYCAHISLTNIRKTCQLRCQTSQYDFCFTHVVGGYVLTEPDKKAANHVQVRICSPFCGFRAHSITLYLTFYPKLLDSRW